MIIWRGLMPWLFRAWPVLVLVPVALAHALSHSVVSDHAMANKVFGMALQLLGGLLVLYSVNDNLGLFRSQSFLSAIVGWAKDFPLRREPVVVSGNVGVAVSGCSAMALGGSVVSSTIEGRLSELERRVEALRGQLQVDMLAVNARIDASRTEARQQLAEAHTRIADLSKRLEHAAVGGFKLQALGVMLAIYGAITSVFA